MFEALDAQRAARGISWRQVAIETGVSVATLTSGRRTGPMEADGVRAIVAWVGRAPEDFVRTAPGNPPPMSLFRPAATQGRTRRLDTVALHTALDAERLRRGLTWTELASSLGDGVSVSMLTRLKKRGRMGMDVLVAATGWLGASIETFTYESDR